MDSNALENAANQSVVDRVLTFACSDVYRAVLTDVTNFGAACVVEIAYVGDYSLWTIQNSRFRAKKCQNYS